MTMSLTNLLIILDFIRWEWSKSELFMCSFNVIPFVSILVTHVKPQSQTHWETFSCDTIENKHGGCFQPRVRQNQSLDCVVLDISLRPLVHSRRVRHLHIAWTSPSWRKHHLRWVELPLKPTNLSADGQLNQLSPFWHVLTNTFFKM